MEQNLSPLRIMREVNLKFDKVALIARRGAWRYVIIIEFGQTFSYSINYASSYNWGELEVVSCGV